MRDDIRSIILRTESKVRLERKKMIKIRRKSAMCFLIMFLLGGFLLFTKEHFYQLMIISIIAGMLCSLIKDVKIHNMKGSLFITGLSAGLMIADKIYDIGLSNWGTYYVTFLWIWTIFLAPIRQYSLFSILEKFYPHVKIKYDSYKPISEWKQKEEYLDNELRKLENNSGLPQVRNAIEKYNAMWVIIPLHFEIVFFMSLYQFKA